MAYIGKWGERKACKFLSKNGVFIEKTNAKNRFCELDIIAFKKRTLIFAEVKTRHIKNAINFPIFESITDNKIKNINKGIKIYLNDNYTTVSRRRIKEYRSDFIFIHYKYNFLKFPKVVEIIWKKQVI